MPAKPDLRSSIDVDARLDLAATLAPLRVGVSDPCWRAEPSGAWWWATRTPEGPVTVRLVPRADAVDVEEWGDGAGWLAAHLDRLVGRAHRSSASSTELVLRLAQRFPGFRIAGHSRIADAAVDGICRRGVSTFEAARSWSLMVETMGDDAPGPGGLRLPPAPRRLASCDPYELHVMGLEAGRADEVRRVASHANRLEPAPTDGGEEAIRNLAGIAGVGSDAVEHARAVALGDPDAVPVLDAHRTAAVVRTLWGGGRPGNGAGDIEALLAEQRPDRGRLVRLIALADTADAADDVGLRP